MEKNFFCTFFDDNLFGHHSFGSASKKTNAQNQIIVSSSAAAKKNHHFISDKAISFLYSSGGTCHLDFDLQDPRGHRHKTYCFSCQIELNENLNISLRKLI